VSPLQSVTEASQTCHIPDPVLGGPAHIAIDTTRILGTCFDYIGKLHRQIHYRDRGVDQNALRFFKEKGIPIPDTHRYANANIEAELPSVSKYGKPPPTFNEEHLNFAVQAMRRYFRPIMGASNVLSVEEVVGELDKSTSGGYPVSLHYMDKREFLETDFSLPYLKNFINDQENERRYIPIWTSSVKAEMRPKEKVLANKLRTFCAAPIEMTVALNTLCLDMNNKFYEAGSKGHCWSAVGMTKFYRGWDKLARRLLKHKNGFALDVSEYDSSVCERLLMEVCDFRMSCLKNTDSKSKLLLQRLYTHIVHSVMVLSNGDLVQKHGGNPSGSSNTVVDNTLVLMIMFVYCTSIMYEKRFGSKMTHDYLMEHFELALYGDDNTGTVSDEAAKWWNVRDFIAVAATIGFRITSEDDVYEFRPLTELKFLSSGFAHIDTYDVWVPVASASKNLCSLVFGCKDRSPLWAAYRANALYVEAFFTPARAIIDQYRDWLLANNRELFNSDSEVRGVTPKSVMSSWFSEREAFSLYVGYVQ